MVCKVIWQDPIKYKYVCVVGDSSISFIPLILTTCWFLDNYSLKKGIIIKLMQLSTIFLPLQYQPVIERLFRRYRFIKILRFLSLLASINWKLTFITISNILHIFHHFYHHIHPNITWRHQRKPFYTIWL